MERGCAKGDTALVRAALARGFELGAAVNEYGQSLLHVAAMHGQVDGGGD